MATASFLVVQKPCSFTQEAELIQTGVQSISTPVIECNFYNDVY